MRKSIILPTGLLAATIIGAGIFALPYTFEKAGIITGLFYLVIFAGVFTLIHLMYADVIIKTEGFHRFVGYAEIYLGNIGKWLTVSVTVIGMIFVLVIYLILSISFINLIVSDQAIINDFYKLLIFWVLASLPIFLKIDRLALSELLVAFFIILIILIIFGCGLENLIQGASLTPFNLSYLFFPYGAVLFALSGRVAIPSVINYFRKDNQPLSRAKIPIILGTIIPAIVYFLFVLALIGLSGDNVSQDSISGLGVNLPFWILSLLGTLGIISIWSTYIVISRDIERGLEYDFHLSKPLANIFVIFLPIFLYLAGFQNFLNLVIFIGGIFIGLEGILIVLIWSQSLKKSAPISILKNLNPIIIYPLLLIFVIGIIYEIIY